MRMIVISLAAAASALAVASPAAAQYYGQPAYGQGYGYGHNPGYGYGYQDQWREVRGLQARVDQVRDHIRRVGRTNRLSYREARRLDGHAIELQRRIQFAAARGLQRYERRDILLRVEALRQAIRYSVRENRRWGWNGHDGYDNRFGYYGARYRDHDRLGRDDRRRHRDDDRYERDDD